MWQTKKILKKLSSIILTGGVFFLFSGPLSAQESRDLQKLERSLDAKRDREAELQAKSNKLQQQLKTLRQELIRLAQSTQEREALMSSLEQQLFALESDLAQRKDKLAQRRSELSGTLSALSRISHDPSKAFFLYPGTPLESVHSTLLLRAAVPVLRTRADLLREDLVVLSRLREDIQQKYAQLGQAETDLNADRIRLTGLLEEKTALHKTTESRRLQARDAVAAMVKKAKNLRELLNKLNRPQPKPAEPKTDSATLLEDSFAHGSRPTGIRNFPKTGKINTPVRGRLLQRYGQDTGFGQTSKGLMIATRAGAQVIAPFDGQIVFAGPFRNHGLILIIEHVGGYHSVLAGFARVNVVPGQWLLTGEPVGLMAPGGAGQKPALYVELRRKGRPVNPLKWIRADSIKVQG